MLAAAAAPAGGAAAPIIQEITWNVPNVAGDTPEDNIVAKGDACELRFTSAQHPIRQMLPALPWKEVPGHPEVLAPYLPIATVSWAMFFLSDTAQNKLVDNHILTAAAIDRVWKRAVSLNLPLLPKPMGLAIIDVAKFADENYHADFDLIDTDLEETQKPPSSGSGSPTVRNAHIRELAFSNMVTQVSGRRSLVPMCIFEYATGPRTLGQETTLTTSRFQVKSQFAKILSKLYSSHASHHHAVEALASDRGKIDKDELKDAHLEATSEFFSSLACPVTLLPFDFSSCTSTCTKRMIAINNILQWKYDKASHVDIMKKGFDIYVQAWGELALVVLPSHSSTEAYNRADRLRMELMPSSTEMCEATMDSLNVKIKDHRPATGISGGERTELALQSIATMGSVGTSSISAVTSTDGSSNSASAPITVDGDWRHFINSSTVKELELYVSTGFASDPVPAIHMIVKTARCKSPVIVQLLHHRATIPGSPALSRMQELRTQVPAALAFYLTAYKDPKDPTKLVSRPKLEGFCLTNNIFDKIFKAKWGSIDPHELIFLIDSKRAPSTAKRFSIARERRWGDKAQNMEVAEIYDLAFHFHGYDSGIFTDLIKPWQDVVGLIRNRDEDDRLDILEEGTKLVDAALVEAEMLFKGMLKTPSPNATLPNKGAALIPDTSPYHGAMTTLFEDVTTNDSRRDRFKRKAAKLKQLEDAVSAGRHSPLLISHARACLCGAAIDSCIPCLDRPTPHERGHAR